MKLQTKPLICYAAMAAIITCGNAAENPKSLPDLTQNNVVDRDQTYNLGATGLRGWIYIDSDNAGAEGLITAPRL